ncbi:MAG: caspase family protein [Ignavibacteriales bacterium]|nr:caspase family protein [Ignavibacteriales bacterium]
MKTATFFSCIVLLASLAFETSLAQTSKAESNTGSLSLGARKVLDTTGPTIELLEPHGMTQRGLETTAQVLAATTSTSSLVVRGIARDSSGVAMVLVNEREAELKLTPSGAEFSYSVLLVIGENEIEIRAIDRFKNKTELRLVVVREESIITGKFFALIIAVQNYKDQTINSLDYPLQDGENVANALTENYTFDKRDITMLKDPDRKEIIKVFTDLRTKLTSNDNLVIFYAGHGIWDEGLRQGYWLPSNANATEPSEWLPNSTVRDYIRGIKSKHTLLLADACFSGGIFKTRDALPRPDMAVQKTYELPSKTAITSGAMKSVPDKSVFIEYLVKKLRENKEKYLYAQRLYLQLKDPVINNSPNSQTPLHGVINEAGDEGGDFIFVKR